MSGLDVPIASLREIYLVASQIADAVERENYLQSACGNNVQLKQRVEKMLAADDNSPSLLDDALAKMAPLVDALDNVGQWRARIGEPTVAEMDGVPTASFDEQKADAEHTAAPERFGQYEILHKLGEGGMGTVYLAHQQEPIERHVAIKVINPGMDSRQILARFRLEQQALERMKHPNVAQVLDAGLTSRGRPFLVMEWVDGVRIDRFCIEQTVDLDKRLMIFVDICLAVHHAHQRGFIHRDLKPSNVMITMIDGHYVAKVIDFGVTKALDTSAVGITRLTDIAQLLGTPEYMSPEQASWGKQEVGIHSDIYSLGALLYLLVTGVPPLDRELLRKAGLVELQQCLQEMRPLRPSQRMNQTLQIEPASESQRMCPLPDARKELRRVRAELDWIVLQALEKQPQRRYDSAKLLASDVQRFLEGEPIQASPPTLSYRLRRWASRYRVAIAFASAVLLTALAGGGIAVRNGLQTLAALEQSRMNETQALTLLEASQLHESLSHLSASNLVAPATKPLSEADRQLWEKLSSRASIQPDNGSLLQLLSSVMQPQPETTFQHPGPIYHVKVHEESQKMSVCCADGWVYLWDLKDHQLLYRFGQHMGITTATFSPDLQTLLTGDQDGYLRVWDLQTGSQRYSEGPSETGIASIVWSPAGDCVAIGYRFHHVSIRDTQYAEKFQIVSEATAARNSSFLFSEDGKRLFVPSSSHGIEVWDMAQQRCERYLNPITRESQQQVLARTPVKRLTVAQEERLYFYSLESMMPQEMCWADNQKRWILVSSWRAGLLAVDTQSTAGWILPTELASPNAISMAGDGQLFVMSYRYGTISVRKPKRDDQGTVITIDEAFRFQAHQRIATGGSYPTVATLLSSGELVSGGEDGNVHFWDLSKVTPHQEVFEHGLPFVEAVSSDELLCLELGDEQPVAKLVRRSIMANGTRKVLAEVPFLSWKQLRDKNIQWIYCWQHVKPFAVHKRHPVVAICGPEAVELRHTETGALLGSIPADQAFSVSFARDVNSLLIGGFAHDQYSRLYHLSDDFRRSTLAGQWRGSLRSIRSTYLLKDGKSAIQREGEYFVERATKDGEILKPWKGRYKYFDLNTDESLIALHSDGVIEVFERSSGHCLFRSPVGSDIKHMQFCDNSKILLTLHADEQLLAWHLPTGTDSGNLLTPSKQGYLPMGMKFLPHNPNRLLVCYKATDRSDSLELQTLGTPLPSQPTAKFSTGRASLSEESLAKLRFDE